MYIMENQLKTRRARGPKNLQQVGAVTGVLEAMEQLLNQVEKVGSFHSHKTLVIIVVKAGIKRIQIAKLWK